LPAPKTAPRMMQFVQAVPAYFVQSTIPTVPTICTTLDSGTGTSPGINSQRPHPPYSRLLPTYLMQTTKLDKIRVESLLRSPWELWFWWSFSVLCLLDNQGMVVVIAYLEAFSMRQSAVRTAHTIESAQPQAPVIHPIHYPLTPPCNVPLKKIRTWVPRKPA
jgi:hypothetical protein